MPSTSENATSTERLSDARATLMALAIRADVDPRYAVKLWNAVDVLERFGA